MSNVVRRFGLLAAVALAFVPAANAQEPNARVTFFDFTPHGLVMESIARIEAQNFAGAAELLEAWPADAGERPPEALYLLAFAHQRLGNYAKALPPAEEAAKRAPDAPASWLELLTDLLKRNDRHYDAVPWLERLIETNPDNKTYWLELSLAYESGGDFAHALATMRLANTAKLLTDDAEFRRLADLLVHQGLPQQGATVLEEGLAARTVRADETAYTKLGTAWFAAGETDKAVLALENATRSASSGDAYVRLAAVHVERRDWPAAVAALHAGMGRGSLTDAGRANLLMGIALYAEGKFDEARDWLAMAAEDAQQRPAAERYLDAIKARTGPAAL